MGLLRMAAQYSQKETGFDAVDLKKAYRMIVPPALVATRGEKYYDLTPYGWIMPLDYKPVTRVIFSSDPDHQAVANIRRTGDFAVCIPTDIKAQFIQQCGTISSPDHNKYEIFKIPAERASVVDELVPKTLVSGWIEFRLIKMVEVGAVVLVMGEAVAAYEKKSED